MDTVAQTEARLRLPARDPSLRGLMQLYESAYRRLQCLLPEWPLPFESAVSDVAGDRPLHADLLQSSPYTTVLRLTYLFDGEPQPDLVVKVYRDAKLAEALSVGGYSRCALLRDLDFESESAVYHQWPSNLLMDKWLDYLLRCGHGFGLAERPRRAGG